MRFTGLLLGAALALSAGCAPAPAADHGAPAGSPAALQALLDHWRARAGVPAVTLTVGGPGAAAWAGASGTAERGGGAPVPPDVPFRVASVTKTFVATVVLQLAEAGALRLDDPLARWVPGFPGAGAVTIRQLLDHTSGIPDYGRAPGIGKRLLADRDRRWSTADVLALVAGTRRDAAPGRAYSYSNTNYVLLGEVIRAVTGAGWAEEVRRRVIDPLGLRGTFVAGAEPGAERGAVAPVAGYFDADNDGHTENVWDRPWASLETSEGAAGALVSTGPDLARFVTALFRGELLTPASLAAMTREGPHHPRFSNYGLGVEILRPDYETVVWGHGGSLPGFRSAMWYLPDRGVAIVVLANEWRSDPGDLAELAMRRLGAGAR